MSENKIEKMIEVGSRYRYNEETLRVLANISAWTHPSNRPDIDNSEKLKIIRDELSKILP